jgi:hypothetical protein
MICMVGEIRGLVAGAAIDIAQDSTLKQEIRRSGDQGGVARRAAFGRRREAEHPDSRAANTNRIAARESGCSVSRPDALIDAASAGLTMSFYTGTLDLLTS